MRVHLSGHLNWYDPDKRTWVEVALAAPLPLREVLARLGVPADQVAFLTVNNRLAELDGPPVSDADVIELFPPISGG